MNKRLQSVSNPPSVIADNRPRRTNHKRNVTMNNLLQSRSELLRPQSKESILDGGHHKMFHLAENNESRTMNGSYAPQGGGCTQPSQDIFLAEIPKYELKGFSLSMNGTEKEPRCLRSFFSFHKGCKSLAVSVRDCGKSRHRIFTIDEQGRTPSGAKAATNPLRFSQDNIRAEYYILQHPAGDCGKFIQRINTADEQGQRRGASGVHTREFCYLPNKTFLAVCPGGRD